MTRALINQNVAAPWTAWFSSGNMTHSESTKVKPENYVEDMIKETFFFLLDLEYWECDSRDPCHLWSP